MRAPGIIISVGLCVGVALAAFVDEGSVPAGRLLVLTGSISLSVLLGWCVQPARQGLAAHDSRPTSADSVVPDQIIEVMAIPNVECEANVRDPRFGRIRRSSRDEPLVPTSPDRASRGGLVGRVLIATVLMEEDFKPWTDLEIARTMRALIRGSAWLEGEATRWGASLKVAVAGGYFVFPLNAIGEEEIAVGNDQHSTGLHAQGEGLSILEMLVQGAAGFGYRDFFLLTMDLEARFPDWKVVWVVVPRRIGRSFAWPNLHSTALDCDLVVCYPAPSNFPEPVHGSAPRPETAVVVHEILHLFGATDKYGKPIARFPRGTVSRFDIMRMGVRRLSRLRIDWATAFEIGWVARASK